MCKTQHRINESVVLELISELLKAIAEYARHDRAEFIRVVQEAQNSQQTAEVRKKKTRLATAKNRLKELEVLLCKIYEDNILGKLPEERRPIGHWGRLHQSYLKLYRPILYNELILSGRLHTVLADLNEQAADRLNLIIRQMAQAEGVTEATKVDNQMLWVQSMNSIRNRAEEIIKAELIYC